MKRKLMKQARGFILNTVNGLNTKSGQIYLKELKEFVPNADGYNEALAEEVYATIEDNQTLWEQGSWRKLFDVASDDDYVNDELANRGFTTDDLQRELEAMAAFKQDIKEPPCGTAMCFAGWTVELNGADWVVDSKVLHAFGRSGRYLLEGWMENVLVPRHAPLTPGVRDWTGSMPKLLVKTLANRGFTPETHYLTSVPEYAMQLLHPPVSSEESDLFGGDNDLYRIREILDEWSELSKERCEEIAKDKAKADAGA